MTITKTMILDMKIQKTVTVGRFYITHNFENSNIIDYFEYISMNCLYYKTYHYSFYILLLYNLFCLSWSVTMSVFISSTEQYKKLERMYTF